MGRYAYNDNLHSQLAQAHAPAQRRIDALHEGARPRYGQAAALQIESDAALTDFTMGGTVRGVTWSLNPYVGCLHRCTYCYVPETMHLERNRWGRYVVAKDNLPQRLRLELNHKPARTVYVSTATDPYQAAERDHEITRRCLTILARHDWPVDVLTRSPLVLRDVDILRRFTRLRVGMSVPTIDDEARRIIEPAAPAIRERLRALRSLAKAGLTVYANYTPAYPPTGGARLETIADAFRETGVQWVNSTPWRRVSTFLGPLWDRAHESKWKPLAEFVANPERQKAFHEDLAKALNRVGIPVHAGFYNPPFQSAITYEPTSQTRLEVETAPSGSTRAATPILAHGAFRGRT